MLDPMFIRFSTSLIEGSCYGLILIDSFLCFILVVAFFILSASFTKSTRLVNCYTLNKDSNRLTSQVIMHD